MKKLLGLKIDYAIGLPIMAKRLQPTPVLLKYHLKSFC
jgi:hypothetical protein